MVRTSTAERFGYRCPDCGDELSQDPSGKGFVKHMSNRECRFEEGQRDTSESVAGTSVDSTQLALEARIASFSGRSVDRIRSILERATTSERVMPPTELFNEGWLLRLALDWFACRPDVSHPLGMPAGARWYSEALLPSQFAARSRGDSLAETHTHADGAIGHFRIGHTGKGDLALESGASHFVVLEAKLNSKLSSGVKNAPGFDQAARTVACIAYILSVARVRPEQMSGLGFFVVAPTVRIDGGVFATKLAKESIRQKVERRVRAYKSMTKDQWFSNQFLPVLDVIDVEALSWESVAATIEEHDNETGAWFTEFYECSLYYNGLPAK